MSKRTTRTMNALDVRKLQREGMLIPGNWFEQTWTRQGRAPDVISVQVNTDGVRLIYRSKDGDTWQNIDSPVMLTWTACNYGGRRAWWQCPCCGRRVALLYGGKTFACRHCHKLAYQSDRSSKGDKPYARANKVRTRLGWGGGVASPMGSRPKGMHATTYLRLLNQLNFHGSAALQSTDRLVSRLMGKLDSIGVAR